MIKTILISVGIAYGIPFAISFFVDSDKRRVFRRVAVILAFMILLYQAVPIAEHFKYTEDEYEEAYVEEETDEYVEEEPDLLTEIEVHRIDEVDVDMSYPISVISAEASSALHTNKGYTYGPELTLDGDVNSCWQEGVDGDGVGEYIKYVFDGLYNTQFIRLVNGQVSSEKKYYENGRIAQVELQFYNTESNPDVAQATYVVDIPDEPAEYILILEGVAGTDQVDEVYVYINDVYSGSRWSDTCVSEVGFY